MNVLFKIVLLYLLLTTHAYGQISSAVVGIDGLTCSMCSYSVENSIKQLSYISAVKMDLNKNIAEIEFKFNSKPDVEEIAKKVKNAGFSVRYLKIKIPEDVEISEKGTFIYQNKEYLILNYKKGFWREKQVSFIGKDFLPKKEFKNLYSKFSKEQRKAYNSENIYLIKIED